MIATIQNAWSWLAPIQPNLIALVFTLIGAGIFYLFRPRVKLIFGRANNSLNVLFTPDQADKDRQIPNEIYVEKFFLQNQGRKAATKVEFVLSSSPTDVVVFPPTDVTYKVVEKGNLMVSIPNIAPSEQMVVDCLYINQKASFVSSVRCVEGLGREVPFWTLRRLPKWLLATFWVLIILGVAFLIQMISLAF